MHIDRIYSNNDGKIKNTNVFIITSIFYTTVREYSAINMLDKTNFCIKNILTSQMIYYSNILKMFLN